MNRFASILQELLSPNWCCPQIDVPCVTLKMQMKTQYEAFCHSWQTFTMWEFSSRPLKCSWAIMDLVYLRQNVGGNNAEYMPLVSRMADCPAVPGNVPVWVAKVPSPGKCLSPKQTGWLAIRLALIHFITKNWLWTWKAREWTCVVCLVRTRHGTGFSSFRAKISQVEYWLCHLLAR